MFKALHFLFVVLLACLTLIVGTWRAQAQSNELIVCIRNMQTAQYSADSPACAKLCSDKLPVADVSTPAFS